MVLYTEVPQEMVVLHNAELLEGAETFTVMAEDGAFVSLTVNGEIIGTGEATDGSAEISIPQQAAGDQMMVTVTKQNYYRYEGSVEIIESNIPYVVQQAYSFDEVNGNSNGLVDNGESISFSVSMENLGNVQANNVEVTITTDSEFITFTDDTENYGNLQPGDIVNVDDAFTLDVSPNVSDQDVIIFDLNASDGSDTWTSQVYFVTYAPDLKITDFVVFDPTGNENGRIDPGETVYITLTVLNDGSADAFNLMGNLLCENEGITVISAAQAYGDLLIGGSSEMTFEVYADPLTQAGIPVSFDLNLSGDGGISVTTSYEAVVGQLIALVLDLDPSNHSGPAIYETFANMDIYAEYKNEFPEDLGLYRNVFLSLGLKFDNYVLTAEEGDLLAEYLQNGGNLYMEGRVTWDDDPQTAVHPMFNIEVNTTSMFAIYNAVGVPGSMTSDFSFEYEGLTPINDYTIEGIAPAVNLFTTQDDDKFTMVAYDEGSYKTIGSTIELGKLVDAESPNTKTELVLFLLDWFDDGIVTGLNKFEGQSSYSNGFVSYPNPTSGQVNFSFTLKKNENVEVQVLNTLGEVVFTQNRIEFTEGDHAISMDASNLKPGVYFVNMTIGNQVYTNKIAVK